MVHYECPLVEIASLYQEWMDSKDEDIFVNE